MWEENRQRRRDLWSTRKKDVAPRGVYRHRSGMWAIRFTCGAGHIHKEQVGRVKSEAIDWRNERRARSRREPGWCPLVEARRARDQAKESKRREQARVSFAEHTRDFIQWAKVNHRSWEKDDSRLSRVTPVLGDKKLDEITTADVEHFLASLREGERAVSPASVNRYRDLLSGLFKRAMRLGLVASNPVRGIPKLREVGRRLVYLPPDGDEEAALRDALASELRQLFTVSLHTGLRWSEQMALRWRDADVLSGLITVGRSKNGSIRQVPMNSVVRSVLFDLGARRQRPNDPEEPIFVGAYRTVARAFSQAVTRDPDGAQRVREGRQSPLWLYVAREPPQLRQQASHGQCGSQDGSGAWRLEDAWDGAAVRPPRAESPPGGRRAVGADEYHGTSP